MQAFMADHIRAIPASTSWSGLAAHSFARFISAMVCPLSRAISNISAAVPNGNGDLASSDDTDPALFGWSRSRAVTTKPPPIE